MSGNNNGQGGINRNPLIVGAVATGLGVLAGGVAYWLSTRQNPAQTESAHNATGSAPVRTQQSDNRRIVSELSNLFQRMGSHYFTGDKVVPRSAVPSNPSITNLNGLLADIYVRFVQLKSDDFQLHYNVFTSVFGALMNTMKQVDPYMKRYSSDVLYAGSHYDGLRIKRPDEFDMDIVISLPLNYNVDSFDPAHSDIVLEAKGAGFVQLRMGQQYTNLPMRDGPEWQVNKAAFQWRDDKNFLLRTKFLDWFKSVVCRALQLHEAGGVPTFNVDNTLYTVRRTETGPAITIIIESARGFRLDVDLVPALKFPSSRWPPARGYRPVPRGAARPSWLLVPKTDKAAPQHEQARMWRIALQDQERELMKGLYNCKQIIRLLKKLKDAQDMKKIASYYVKTLFLWEIVERDDPMFWRKSPAELFVIMVRRFHSAMIQGSIPYFWNQNNNLIGLVDRGILNGYAEKLSRLLVVLSDPTQYRQVAQYLLSRNEYTDYYNRFLRN